VPHDTGVEETGSTYDENARLKAEAAVAQTGLPALGDDSGLEVEALGGFPGLHSARLAPTQKERTEELLRRLSDLSPSGRRAKFVSVIALARPGGPTTFYRGEVTGEILTEWRGTAGFGYDPVFVPSGADRTFGEMDAAEKHRWSHRAAAVRVLLTSGDLKSLT
jgi:XTP/dITP diphosphohydrolase